MSSSQETPDRPIARPVASSKNPPLRSSDGSEAGLTAGNTVSTSSAHNPSSQPQQERAGTLRLHAVRDSLLPRDLAILRSVAAHRFLTTRQIQSLHFSDHGSPLAAIRSTNRVLRRLAQLRLISHLERRVGGVRAGSASYVWQLGPLGDRVLRAESGSSTRKRQREPSVRLLDHTLAVADIHVALTQASRSTDLELVDVQVEPGSWRRFLDSGGETRLLRPDLAVVTAQGEYEDHWFIEADLDTEHPPTVVRKCQLYEEYRASGHEQETHGVFPRVLWVVPSQVRVDTLSIAIRQARLDTGLFRVTTIDQLVSVVIGGAA